MLVPVLSLTTVWCCGCCDQGLMRELELREKKVNAVQTTGDKLLRDGHPARKTIEVGADTRHLTLEDEN